MATHGLLGASLLVAGSLFNRRACSSSRDCCSPLPSGIGFGGGRHPTTKYPHEQLETTRTHTTRTTHNTQHTQQTMSRGEVHDRVPVCHAAGRRHHCWPSSTHTQHTTHNNQHTHTQHTQICCEKRRLARTGRVRVTTTSTPARPAARAARSCRSCTTPPGPARLRPSPTLAPTPKAARRRCRMHSPAPPRRGWTAPVTDTGTHA